MEESEKGPGENELEPTNIDGNNATSQQQITASESKDYLGMFKAAERVQTPAAWMSAAFDELEM